MSIGKFFRNLSSEMRKVSWPKRKELSNYTVTVVVTVILFTLFFLVVDAGISALIKWFLNLN